ncbi:MAG: NYN domain-containing protein [Chloroflexi bacterium]|nr:NYN domain-containing protein [Chloroflexota bacterium]
MTEQRVVLFVDSQNLYHCARAAFFAPDASHTHGQCDPIRLGELICSRPPQGFTRVLHQTRIYTGRPESGRQPKAYGAHMKQCAAWQAAGAAIISRTLRYPPDWPSSKAQEKGIDVALAIDFVALAIDGAFDVGIICSTDSDLKPALEYVSDKFDGGPRGEVMAWRSPTASRRLSIQSKNVWCHQLDRADYDQVSDHTDYNL